MGVTSNFSFLQKSGLDGAITFAFHIVKGRGDEDPNLIVFGFAAHSHA